MEAIKKIIEEWESQEKEFTDPVVCATLRDCIRELKEIEEPKTPKEQFRDEFYPPITKFTCATCESVLAWKEDKEKDTTFIIPCKRCVSKDSTEAEEILKQIYTESATNAGDMSKDSALRMYNFCNREK
jgi:hypothetical protein